MELTITFTIPDIHIFVHSDSGGATLEKLDQILAQLGVVQTQETEQMASIVDLQAAADRALVAITDESVKDDAIIALVNANTAQIAALRQQLADALAAIQAVLESLTAAESSALANSARVLAAVNANTPTA